MFGELSWICCLVLCCIKFNLVVLNWVELNCVCWVGLFWVSWVILDWIGLGVMFYVGLGCTRLTWSVYCELVLSWVVLGCVGLGGIMLGYIISVWAMLHWVELSCTWCAVLFFTVWCCVILGWVLLSLTEICVVNYTLLNWLVLGCVILRWVELNLCSELYCFEADCPSLCSSALGCAMQWLGHVLLCCPGVDWPLYSGMHCTDLSVVLACIRCAGLSWVEFGLGNGASSALYWPWWPGVSSDEACWLGPESCRKQLS